MLRRTPTAASVLTLALPFACSDPLTMLAYKHGTDKASHGFTSFYHKIFGALRFGFEHVMEIGVFSGGC